MKLDDIKVLWQEVPDSESINIYINTPFCYCNCRYCMYQGNKYNRERVNNYYDYYFYENLRNIVKIIENRKIDTVYFGGGTPNCMSIDILRNIIDILGNLFTDAKARIIELNPSFLSDEFIEEVGKQKFTLATLGIQTFDMDSLVKMKRMPLTYERFNQIIIELRKSGVRYISIDLMAYVQSYSKNDLDKYLSKDLEKAFTAGLDFLTIYPELNLIKIDNEADDYFKDFILKINHKDYYRDTDNFNNNPRSIIRFINKKHNYEKYLDEILPYYEDDFPYADMNIIGIGDYYSKQNVISYSPKRFCYVEKYTLAGPEYDILYHR